MSNLTPKEKAKELVLMFKVVPMGYGFNEVSWSIPLSVAKLLALRCVDEILIIMNEEYLSGAIKINYWQEVKKEIKLYE